MNHKLFEKYDLYPKRICKRKKIEIIEDIENKKYVAKENKKKTKDVYQYLRSRNFPFFPEVYTDWDDPIELTKYIEDTPIDTTQRMEDMIYLTSILHTKTAYYKSLDLDKIKEIYETMEEEYAYLLSYYTSCQNMMEEEVYMAPSHYYFLLNISKVYKILEYGKERLESWYQEIIEKRNIRFVFNHNNLKKDHLLENDQLYFISWDSAQMGFPTDDLERIFQESYKEIDLETLLHLYESRFRLFDYERNYLMAKLFSLKRINFNQEEVIVIKEVANFIDYLDNLYLYLSKQNSSKSNQNPKQKG